MNTSEQQPKPASFWKTEPFRIVEIVAVAAPDGGDGGNWFRYVISQGDKPIEGHRQGTPASVREAVDEFVQRLNERRLGAPGRVPYAPGAKKGVPRGSSANRDEEAAAD
jgi:hypothetical protein